MRKRIYTRSKDCNLLSLPETSSELNLSPSTIEKLAKECNAKLKIGRIARYRIDLLRDYIDSFTVGAEE